MKSAYRMSHTGRAAGVPASWGHHYIAKPGFFGCGTGQVAQLVEQRTENPRVGSSILPLAITSMTMLVTYTRSRWNRCALNVNLRSNLEPLGSHVACINLIQDLPLNMVQ